MCFYSSMSAADEQQYISVSFLSPLRWHIMLGALRTSNMTASSFLGSLSRIYKICSKVEWAIEFPSKYRRTFHIWGFIRGCCLIYKKPELYKKSPSGLSAVATLIHLWLAELVSPWLCAHSLPELLPIFSPLFIAYWSSREQATCHTFKMLSKCFWNPSTFIKSYLEKNDPESSGSVE